MNKFVLLATALTFILPSASYTMDDKEPPSLKRKYPPKTSQQHREERPSKKAKLQPLSKTERLSTPESHTQYLQDAISSATKSILITSHGVDKDAFKKANLYTLLKASTDRGVRVYIYNIDSKDIDNKISEFFKKNGIAYDVAYTHAKLLAVDDKMVAIGSHNWLARTSSWENATLCLSGKECTELVPLLWKDLKYYRNIQFGNEKQIRQYEKNLQNEEIDTWKLASSTALSYVHSLTAHQDFISGAFKYAENTLVFCSPFINEKSGYQEDFKKTLLSKTINKGVHVHFVCRAEDPNLPSFRKYLGSLLESPFMHLIPLSDIHLKTVIIDDTTIAEGSFNWLSASRDEESEYHNHEVTLMMGGCESKGFIQDFYKSPVGQEVLKATPVQKPPLPKAPVRQKNIQQDFPNGASSSKINFQNISDPNAELRVRWLALKWKTSAKGNPYINTSKEDGNGKNRNVVIFKKQNNTYSASIDGTSLNVWYPSELKVKEAIFDFIWSSP
jgi:phosphatidylserine/phosphatidylglycerophosphate/cardiolipin synthase-like enzyme